MECLQGMACCPGLAHYLGARLKTGRGFIAFDADDAAQAPAPPVRYSGRTPRRHLTNGSS